VQHSRNIAVGDLVTPVANPINGIGLVVKFDMRIHNADPDGTLGAVGRSVPYALVWWSSGFQTWSMVSSLTLLDDIMCDI
jgi:hypothetical protein